MEIVRLSLVSILLFVSKFMHLRAPLRLETSETKCLVGQRHIPE